MSLYAQVQEMQKAINSESYEEGMSHAPAITNPRGTLDYDHLAKNPISRDTLLEALFQDQLRKLISGFVTSTLDTGETGEEFKEQLYRTWEMYAKKEVETTGAVLEISEDIAKKLLVTNRKKTDGEVEYNYESSKEAIWANWENELFKHTDSWLIKFPNFEVLIHRYGGNGFILKDFIGSMYSPLTGNMPDLSQNRYKNSVIKKYIDEAVRLHSSVTGFQFTKKVMKKFKGNREKALAACANDMFRVFAHELFMSQTEKIILHIDAAFPKGMTVGKDDLDDFEGKFDHGKDNRRWVKVESSDGAEGRSLTESCTCPVTMIFESKDSINRFCTSAWRDVGDNSPQNTAHTNIASSDVEYFEGGDGVLTSASALVQNDMFHEVRVVTNAVLKILTFCAKTEFVNKFKSEERIPDEEGGGTKRAPKLPPKKIVYLPKQFMHYHKTGEVREPSDRDITPHNRREHKRILRHPRFGANVGKVISVKKSKINGGEDKDREVVYKVNEKSNLIDILYGKKEAISKTVSKITKRMKDYFGNEE
jgi:hypothetical protein